MLLSVCIIARNEAANIQRCIDSVANVADQIIVNDTGSEDDTILILDQLSAKLDNLKIIRSKWKDDFSAARNETSSFAEGKWLFHIDADEELTTPDVLLTALRSTKKSIGGLLWNLRSYSSDKQNGTKFYSSVLRIFRNQDDIKFQGRVHEQVLNSIIGAGLEIAESKIEGIHHGYSLNKLELVKKHERNIKLLELEIADIPSSYSYLQLGKSYMAIEKLDNSLLALEKSLAYESSNHPLINIQIYNNLALCYLQLDLLDKSEQLAKKSITLNPNQIQPHFILGDIYRTKQDFQNALLEFQAILRTKLDKNALIVGEFSVPESEIHLKIALLYCEIGNYEMADGEIKKGLKINSNHAELLSLQTKLMTMKKEATAILPTISVCMIIKDEEKFLEGALQSVNDIADQIVIIDTGSKDRSIAIAREYGAEVHFYKWSDDFSVARNESLKQARCDWILYLDADERIKKLNPFQLKQSLSNLPTSVGGIICTIESVHSKLTGGKEMHRGGYPRLFRNLGYPKIHFKGRVHEQITPSLKDNNLNIVPSDVVIEHLGYDRSREEMEKKVKRNYKLLLDHVREEPLNGYAWYQLGQTLGQMGLFEQSENAINFAIQTKALSASVLASAYSTLSQYAGRQKKFKEALAYAEQSLQHGPNQIYAMNLKAYALTFLGRKEEALKLFHKILDLYENAENSIPNSGFDIVLSKDIVYKGIEMAQS